MWRFLRLFKTAHQKVLDFREGRSRQPDDEFLADCGLRSGTEAARVALAVRRAVAGTGLVDPLFVRAKDSYPGSLEVLPIWDSMDWLMLQFEIERELGQNVPLESSEMVPESWPITVSDMAARLLELLSRSATAEPDAPADGGRDTGF